MWDEISRGKSAVDVVERREDGAGRWRREREERDKYGLGGQRIGDTSWEDMPRAI